ncbi:MAG: putative pyridoxal phosphate-dependent acyltransferase, partial [Anaerophaga sp.]|nr:putative pyridoxal phosphate-dependent acyltransferase [Anaerophaga sp.]
MDIFDKISENMGPLGQYGKDAHGYFMFPKLEGEIHPHMIFRGKKVLTWSLNNYLGLANHPEVREVDGQAAKDWGLGYPMGARMMSGHTSKHEELEAALADFVGKEDAYLLNFGYQGMVSIIDTLAGRNDVIVYDSECHACIMDGIFLHKAKGGKSFVFPHNDIERCEKMLSVATRRAEESGGGILLITEAPHPDLGAIHFALKNNSDFNFEIAYANEFKEEISKYDLVILYQLPSIKNNITNILKEIQKNKISVLYILGINSSINDFNKLTTGVEIYSRTKSFEDATATYNNTFTSFDPGIESNYLKNLSPLKTFFGDYKIFDNVKILFYQNINGIKTHYYNNVEDILTSQIEFSTTFYARYF